MKKNIRALSCAGALAASIAMVTGLAGCASGGGSEESGDKTVLTVYGWKGTEGEPANVAEINAAFEKAHPDIDVQYEAISGSDAYKQRTQPELLAGDSADVLMVDSNVLPTWAESGYLADLSDQPWASKIVNPVKPYVTANGQINALPLEMIGVGLYSNTALLEQVGITSTPSDWPSFVDALQKLKDAGKTPIALPNKGGWSGVLGAMALAASSVDPDWDEKFFQGDASFEAWEPAIEKLLELQDLGLVDWKTELGVDEWSQGVEEFTSGDVGFWHQGAWNLQAVEKAGVDAKFTAWPGAEAGGTSNALLFVGPMWAVNSASDQQEAAKTYVEFWSDSENLKLFLEAENAISPLTDGESPQSTVTSDFVGSYENGDYRIMPVNTWFAGDVETKLGARIQALFLDEISVDQLIDEVNNSIAKREK